MAVTIGVIFPGQGSQAPGMGADVADNFPAARDCFDRAASVLGYDVLSLCKTGSDLELRETRVSQPAIFTTNVAVYRAVESFGFTPVVSGGHSFGEYCSLTIAGAMQFEEALKLVHARGVAMGAAADLAPGAMAAIIGFEEPAVEELCARARAGTSLNVDIANLNASTQIVVSGDSPAVASVAAEAKNAGAKRVVMLNVSGAWHSKMMEPAVASFSRRVEEAQIEMPSFDVIGNVEAAPYRDIGEIRRCLIASLCSRVRWHETATAIVDRGPDMIIECGSITVLAPMMRRMPHVVADRVLHVADSSGIAKLSAMNAGPSAEISTVVQG
ncbi:MAG: ACP S-malonyltransferase [Candidatus Eremiobacteraeota bacterium]|nr:ACP S-malonyltransferase [Candidatus Eremiobacteraeota bacterium]MBC5826964.1 ACP S-malonyltransferase [Candidatus Eremiobacteraeota bacterium]